MALRGTSIKIPEEVYNALKTQAESEHRTISNLINYVLEKYLDSLKTK